VAVTPWPSVCPTGKHGGGDSGKRKAPPNGRGQVREEIAPVGKEQSDEALHFS